MKTQYYTASSLDGFIAAPGHNLDWLMQFGEPEGGGSYAEFIRDVGAIAMGSSTYEWILRELVKGGESGEKKNGPSAAEAMAGGHDLQDEQDLKIGTAAQIPMPGDGPQPWPYEQPTWVFTSRELTVPPGVRGPSGSRAPDIRFVRGDVRPVHRAMVAAAGGTASGKNLWIAGGGDLVGQFHDAGLLDEIIVQIASVTLGAGAPLLPRAIVTPPMRLTGVQQFGAGFAELRYEVRRGGGGKG
jgi:dihydrofolate reductase